MITRDDVQIVIGDRALRRAGLRAITIMQRRTLSGVGVDEQGNAYRFPPYSEKTFAMPAGGITGQARSRLKGRLHYFETKSGAKWVLVDGGYRALKMARYPQHGGIVNLSAEGRMLRSLAIVGIGQDGQVQIGFARQEEARKAYWNALRGRRFLGLTPDEQAEVAAIAAEGITFKL
ncbi:MAG TPA: hypothetical protein VHI13_16755 [Candidatus Kapabacteria bacterium]|nr:hypothetical protein [Candidatus Kapabacteria bacterium]